jgi:hypothetical protein
MKILEIKDAVGDTLRIDVVDGEIDIFCTESQDETDMLFSIEKTKQIISALEEAVKVAEGEG